MAPRAVGSAILTLLTMAAARATGGGWRSTRQPSRPVLRTTPLCMLANRPPAPAENTIVAPDGSQLLVTYATSSGAVEAWLSQHAQAGRCWNRFIKSGRRSPPKNALRQPLRLGVSQDSSGSTPKQSQSLRRLRGPDHRRRCSCAQRGRAWWHS
eukprot:scaffold9769_cov29-Tisochrysis_lutea.AAC.1